METSDAFVLFPLPTTGETTLTEIKQCLKLRMNIISFQENENIAVKLLEVTNYKHQWVRMSDLTEKGETNDRVPINILRRTRFL